jgi:hypothetical protein
MSESRFTADEARDILYARQDVFERTLAIIRGMVDTQLKDAARQGKASVHIVVPPSVFGREPYNIAVMGRTLAKQLYEDKYDVAGTCTNMIVSWASRDPPNPNAVVAVDKKKKRVDIDVPKPRATTRARR